MPNMPTRQATGDFIFHYPYHVWFKDVFWHQGKNVDDFGSHNVVTEAVYEKWKGHFFQLFRDPARRAVSFYQDKYVRYLRNPSEAMSLEANARLHAGDCLRFVEPRCHGGHTGLAVRPTGACYFDEQVKARLDEGWAYVGITDEFDVSICLFHAKFGGKCSPNEQQNIRPSDYKFGHTSRRDPIRDADELRAKYVDVQDTKLYNYAVERFERELRTYDVTPERCEYLRCLTPKVGYFFADGGRVNASRRYP